MFVQFQFMVSTNFIMTKFYAGDQYQGTNHRLGKAELHYNTK